MITNFVLIGSFPENYIILILSVDILTKIIIHQKSIWERLHIKLKVNLVFLFYIHACAHIHVQETYTVATINYTSLKTFPVLIFSHPVYCCYLQISRAVNVRRLWSVVFPGISFLKLLTLHRIHCSVQWPINDFWMLFQQWYFKTSVKSIRYYLMNDTIRFPSFTICSLNLMSNHWQVTPLI